VQSCVDTLPPPCVSAARLAWPWCGVVHSQCHTSKRCTVSWCVLPRASGSTACSLGQCASVRTGWGVAQNQMGTVTSYRTSLSAPNTPLTDGGTVARCLCSALLTSLRPHQTGHRRVQTSLRPSLSSRMADVSLAIPLVRPQHFRLAQLSHVGPPAHRLRKHGPLTLSCPT
jgi:hypothetical protein